MKRFAQREREVLDKLGTSAIVRCLAWFVLLVTAACSSSPPYRRAIAQLPVSCAKVYEFSERWDDQSAQVAQIKVDLKDAEASKCWLSSREPHRLFELYTVEFDDQGWLARSDSGPLAGSNILPMLFADLSKLTDDQNQPLSIIAYVHGWHHSAEPFDSNVIAFRKLLANAARMETLLCYLNRGAVLNPDGLLDLGGLAGDACSESEKIEPSKRKRRVVGIYVGWRGDSVLGPGIEEASIWDRKLAAEKVSHGSINELFALLHDFYRRHGCHSAFADARCGDAADIRLLTVGHSFGGLIAYRALAPRLMTSVVEPYRDAAPGAGVPYAYSFGDLTVLINPAFEGTRFEPLAKASMNRRYEDASEPHSQRTAQLPILVVAQSTGDSATGTWFPLFRRFTTAFEDTNAAQSEGNLNTVGWTTRYKTHELTFDSAMAPCKEIAGSLAAELLAEAGRTEEMRGDRLRPFHGDLAFCGGMKLVRSGAGNPPGGFTPLWVVQTDTNVLADHNDFLNPRFVRFIRQIYFTVLREQDEYARRLGERR